MPPTLALLADERARIYQRRPRYVKEVERRETAEQSWQCTGGDRAPKGRWTHRIIPNITELGREGTWRSGTTISHQLLSGHGYFKSHSERYDNTLSALLTARPCPITVEDDAGMCFFAALRFPEERERLQQDLQKKLSLKQSSGSCSNRRQLDGGSCFSAHQSVVTRLRQEAQVV
ncbi:unnamed protein product [Trichogramma brassicae]|uniref:Uncharacterized protein n=1 Tax=Trichogramma brassicae TaxID=86971 RepID=A0A6H5J412_9HYME|nr:unnamed protein product [Trichogramma brassicae]